MRIQVATDQVRCIAMKHDTAAIVGQVGWPIRVAIRFEPIVSGGNARYRLGVQIGQKNIGRFVRVRINQVDGFAMERDFSPVTANLWLSRRVRWLIAKTRVFHSLKRSVGEIFHENILTWKVRLRGGQAMVI